MKNKISRTRAALVTQTGMEGELKETPGKQIFNKVRKETQGQKGNSYLKYPTTKLTIKTLISFCHHVL